MYRTSDKSAILLRLPLVPDHGKREILGVRSSGMNLLLSRFRQDQLSNGAVQSLPVPVYSLMLELCVVSDFDTHVSLETFVSNRALLSARSTEEGHPSRDPGCKLVLDPSPLRKRPHT